MNHQKQNRWAVIGKCMSLVMVVGLLLTTGCALNNKPVPIMVSLRNSVPENDFYINSAILAVEEWNGDTSHKVKASLIRYDYNGESPTLADDFSSMIAKDRPMALISSSAVSKEVIRVMPKIHAAGIPFLTQATEGRLTSQRLENLFRLQTSDVMNCTLAVKYISEDLKLKRLAVIYPEGDFGRDFKTDLERAASIYNLQLVMVHAFDPLDVKSLSTAVQAVNKSDAQMCLLWPETGGHLQMMKAMETAPLKMPFFGNPNFQYIGGDQGELKKFEGSFVMSSFMYLSSKAYWRDRMQARFGIRPTENQSPVIYDAVNHILTTLENSEEKPLASHLIAGLHEESYAGVVGTYAYDEKGEGIRQTYIGQIVKGKVKFIKIESSRN